MRWLGLRVGSLSIVGLLIFCGCSSTACPTVGCEPEIDLSFETPMTASYAVTVSVQNSMFTANCPTQVAQLPGIKSCDGAGLVISGVDLGHGENNTVAVMVALNGGQAISTTATLQSITNSRECALVCYIDEGTVAN